MSTKKLKATQVNDSGMGSQAWPELREPIAVLLGEQSDDHMGAMALLSLVTEFRRLQNDRIGIVDLCDALDICVYQESRACELAAKEFAKSATKVFPI